MSAVLHSFEARLEPVTPEWVDAIVAVEQRAYTHPWTRGNFIDSLAVGYHCQMLVAGHSLLGYFVAMKGVDEVHLLNITVAPEYQGQGWARLMLDALVLWARSLNVPGGAQPPVEMLWLEVRASNTRALRVYEARGYQRVGLRKDYYPDGRHGREDAMVMSLRL